MQRQVITTATKSGFVSIGCWSLVLQLRVWSWWMRFGTSINEQKIVFSASRVWWTLTMSAKGVNLVWLAWCIPWSAETRSKTSIGVIRKFWFQVRMSIDYCVDVIQGKHSFSLQEHGWCNEKASRCWCHGLLCQPEVCLWLHLGGHGVSSNQVLHIIYWMM